jgi:hypothetical protein
LRPSLLCFLPVLLVAGTTMAQGPEIGYITEPVVHFAPFLVFGEGFDADRVELLTWAPSGPVDADKLLQAIVTHGLPAPPPAPPKDALVGLYGRVHRLSPQVLGAVMQGAVSVIWVRSAAGVSRPYVVNRPQLFFLEFNPCAPGQAVRLFGRQLNSNPYQPAARFWLVGKQSRQAYPVPWVYKYDYQAHLNDQLPYEMRLVIPADLPEGDYDLWGYNGAGAEYGFGGPLAVTVQKPPARPATRFDVTRYGAKGDGLADDTGAIEAAIQAAGKASGGVVYLPLGKYRISHPLRLLPGVDLIGADWDWSHLIAGEDFRGEFPKEPLPGKAEDWGPYFRQAHAAPMVWAVSSSTIADLTLQGSQATAWCVLIMRPGGVAQDVTVTRCRVVNPRAVLMTPGKWQDNGGGLGSIGPLERVEFSYCEVTALGGLGNIGGPVRHCRTLFNTYHPPNGPWGTSAMGWLLGDECVVEGNRCEYANRGFTTGPWFGPIRRNFIARNLAANSSFMEGAGEVYLFEGPDVGRENWIGRPASAGADFLTQGDQKWPAGVLAGRIALVVHGKGFGQFRVIKDNTENRITLEEPWRIVPDQTSWVAVRQFFYQNLLVNDYCRDTLGGVDFYGGALDNVVESFTGLRSRGVWLFAANCADEKERMVYGPAAFNYVNHCQLLDATGGVIFEDNRRLDMIQPMPLIFGNIVTSNRFVRCGVSSTDRVLQSKTNASWLKPDDPQRQGLPPAVSFNAFGGNSFEPRPQEPSLRFDPWSFATLFWLNSQVAGGPAAVEDKGQGAFEFPRPW